MEVIGHTVVANGFGNKGAPIAVAVAGGGNQAVIVTSGTARRGNILPVRLTHRTVGTGHCLVRLTWAVHPSRTRAGAAFTEDTPKAGSSRR
jgi:hypothetical protein